MEAADPQAWLQERLQRLRNDGFVISENVSLSDTVIPALARRTRFELSKFGMFETFFIFQTFGSVDEQQLRSFSKQAFRLALRSRKVPLPCGFFEGVCCFPVVVTSGLDPALGELVEKGLPVMRYAAIEMPVIFDRANGRLYYSEQTPMRGGAYFAGFRDEIIKYLWG